MIDIQIETVIPLADVPKYLPKLRNGRPIALSTLYRWRSRGVNGVKLETAKLGGTIITSVEALQRFIDQKENWDSVKTGKRPMSRRTQQAVNKLQKRGVIQ